MDHGTGLTMTDGETVSAGVLPVLLKMRDACKQLGNISLTKLKGLIRNKEIASVMLGGTRLIPSAEIMRIATPPPQPVVITLEATSPDEEYQKLLEARKAKRKRGKGQS